MVPSGQAVLMGHAMVVQGYKLDDARPVFYTAPGCPPSLGSHGVAVLQERRF